MSLSRTILWGIRDIVFRLGCIVVKNAHIIQNKITFSLGLCDVCVMFTSCVCSAMCMLYVPVLFILWLWKILRKHRTDVLTWKGYQFLFCPHIDRPYNKYKFRTTLNQWRAIKIVLSAESVIQIRCTMYIYNYSLVI